MRRRVGAAVRAVLAAFAVAGLASCAEMPTPTTQPSFYRSLAQAGATLDAEAAASMISGYRANNGLPPVSLDPRLMQLAETQSRAMAQSGRVDHRPAGAFTARLRRAGYHARTAAENVSAGYHTLAEAFSGWRDSPPHRANMLLKGATKMGIAAVYAPDSKYKVFWTLIMAEPDERRG